MCVRRDTLRAARLAGPALWALLASLALAGAARAAPRALPASLVWTRGDLVYVAAPDSGVLDTGMTLSVMRGKRELATAAITQLLEPRLAVARVLTGSLARERRLDRLRLLGEPAAAPHATFLRVAIPGRGRASPLFACVEVAVAPRLGSAGYTADSLAPALYRLVREPGPEAPSAAPETLLVRLFADAADEEIALERGELDVAVFWPGELSARIRLDARWRDAPRGLRARGVLACVAAADSVAVPEDALVAVNRDVFGGDLLPWSELEPADDAAHVRRARAALAVDPALPGARLLERVLARSAAPARAPAARLAYLDVPLAAHDSVRATWRTRGVTPVFAIRCPVLAAPAARAVVAAVGAGAFADLPHCAGETP